MEKKDKETKKEVKKVEKKFNKEKVQSVVIIILSLIIVFGLAYFVPELKNCGSCAVKEEITEITMADYRKLLADDEISLIYLASPTCGFCAQQQPIMEELVNTYDIEVNYLNTSKLTSSDVSEVYNVYGLAQESIYGQSGLRTPTMLLVQKGALVDMNLGAMELEELVSWLEKYVKLER